MLGLLCGPVTDTKLDAAFDPSRSILPPSSHDTALMLEIIEPGPVSFSNDTLSKCCLSSLCPMLSTRMGPQSGTPIPVLGVAGDCTLLTALR